MNAGVIFCLSYRTALQELSLRRCAERFGFSLVDFRAAASREELPQTLGAMLSRCDTVFLSGSCTGPRPDFCPDVFRLLSIPLTLSGEPDHVLRLEGRRKHGYLIESWTQAIVLLPDLPEESDAMLPLALDRLQQKFSLTDRGTKHEESRLDQLVEDSMKKN